MSKANISESVILIFRSFARMHEIRSKTMNMLHQTPWLLEQVEMFIKLYPNNVRLSDKVDQLYTALLRAITASIQWFGHGTCSSSQSVSK